MPYLSHYIDPAGYGVLSMVNSVVTILIPLVGLTASGLLSVEYYRIKDKEEFASLFSSIQAIPILPGILFLLTCLFFQESIAHFLEIPIGKSYWIPVSVIIALLTIYYENLLVLNVIEQRPKLYLKFSLVRLFVEVGLTLLFVSAFGMGWEGRLCSWMIATVISFFLSAFYFRSRALLTLRISKVYIRAGILFGLPLILHTIGKFVINQSDRIFIAKMVSIEEAGIYNIGYQVGMVMMILVTAITNFIQPFLYARLSDLNLQSKIEIVKTSYGIIIGLFFCLVMLTLASPILFNYLIDKNYAGGYVYVFWTGLSYFIWGVYMVFAGYIFYAKKTKVLGVLSVVNVILNIMLNYFLILKFGAIGASYATCISFFVVTIVVLKKAESLFPLPWFDFKLLFSK